MYKLNKKGQTKMTLKVVNSDDGIKPAIVGPGLDYTKDGAVKTNLKNVILILQTDENLKGLIKYNNFSQAIDIVKPAVLTAAGLEMPLEKGPITDAEEQSILSYLACSNYQIQPALTTLETAIISAANANKYNPLIDYMSEAAKDWDKKPRIKDFLQTYLGADDSEANRLSFKLWLLGAVAKAYDPYTKFDYVLDLVGGQGVGKTTLLKKLAPIEHSYTDQFEGFAGRDDKASFAGCLIANDDEMTASNRVSFEEIKKFITSQEFAYRPAYGHHIKRFHKGFVMARTSNEIQHLKDRSGDRRFLSIECSTGKQKKHPVPDLHKAEVDQLWGEAVTLYKQYQKDKKDPFALTKEQQEVLSKDREKFRATTEVEDALNSLFDGPYKDRKFIPTYQVKTDLIEPLGHEPNRKEMLSVRYLMGHKGFLAGQRSWDAASQSTKRGFLKAE